MTPPAAATARTAPRHARPAARPRPRPVPSPRARRVSGPARPAPSRRATTRPAIAISGGTLLDRLIHGRLWIVIIAGALVGLVFLQVSLLKLNSGIGRAVQSAATLERQNATLRAEVSRLDSGERIQGVANRLGLVMPAAGDRHYLQAGGAAYAAQAARGLTTPAPVVQQPLAPDPTVPAPQVADATQTPAVTAPAATQPTGQAAGAAAQGPPTGAAAVPPAQAAPPAEQTAPATTAVTPTGAAAGGAAAPATG